MQACSSNDFVHGPIHFGNDLIGFELKSQLSFLARSLMEPSVEGRKPAETGRLFAAALVLVST
jgi:hypothetical protein